MFRILCLLLFPVAALSQQHAVRFEQFDSSATFAHIRLGQPFNIMQYTLRLSPVNISLSNHYIVNSKNHMVVEGMQAEYSMAYFNSNRQLSSVVWGISKQRYSSVTVLGTLTHAFGFEERPLAVSSVYRWSGKNIVLFADTSGIQNKDIILVGFQKR